MSLASMILIYTKGSLNKGEVGEGCTYYAWAGDLLGSTILKIKKG
jgi:hypothetical protein